MDLAERIRVVMGDRTPTEFARACKVTPAAVTLWLKGETKALRAETANKMEQVTGYRSGWIVSGKGEKKIDGATSPAWRLSDKLQQRILILPDEELPFLENLLRAHLRMPPTPITNTVGESHLQHTSNTAVTDTPEYPDSSVRERPARRRYTNIDEARHGLGTEDEVASDRRAHRPKDRGGH